MTYKRDKLRSFWSTTGANRLWRIQNLNFVNPVQLYVWVDLKGGNCPYRQLRRNWRCKIDSPTFFDDWGSKLFSHIPSIIWSWETFLLIYKLVDSPPPPTPAPSSRGSAWVARRLVWSFFSCLIFLSGFSRRMTFSWGKEKNRLSLWGTYCQHSELFSLGSKFWLTSSGGGFDIKVNECVLFEILD